jgi:hypothetical protein
MGIESLQSFNDPLLFQDSVVDKLGYPVTVFRQAKMAEQNLGYEDLNFEWTTVKTWINFSPDRRIFYKYNWFPEEGKEDLVSLAFFPASFPIAFDMKIRTSVIESVSPAGDVMLKVVKLNDTGLFKTLRRSAFLMPITDRTLYEKLVPKSIYDKGSLIW